MQKPSTTNKLSSLDNYDWLKATGGNFFSLLCISTDGLIPPSHGSIFIRPRLNAARFCIF